MSKKEHNENHYLYGWVDKHDSVVLVCDHEYGLQKLMKACRSALGGNEVRLNLDYPYDYKRHEFHLDNIEKIRRFL